MLIAARVLLVLLLAACSSTGPVEPLGPTPPPADGGTADHGSGAIKVGVITMAAPDPLSDGSPNSAFQGSQLANSVVSRSPITLLVRPYAGAQGELDRILADLLSAEVSLVILPSDPAVVAAASSKFGAAGVRTISLGSSASLPDKMFAFEFAPEREAAIIGDEVRRRGYKRVVIVSNPKGPAAYFASLVATAIVDTKAEAIPIDGSQPARAAASLAQLSTDGRLPSAIVFLESPSAAAPVVVEIRKRSDFQHVPVIGTTAWSMSKATVSSFAPGWYLQPDANTLTDFATRFEKAFGRGATLEGAMAYDLVVLASALPQALPGPAPYSAEILQNAQGFVGVTGRFSFGPTGQVDRLLFPVELGRD
jgi:ABC-type branched-subunit amino acid transport system substrate-binding protein